MSGHSKWANIKHKKDAVDRKRGMIFTKMTRELMVAAKLGGSDPAANSRLRIALAKARAANVPKDTIERAVKKGAGELEGQSFEEVMYEAYAPGGVGLIIEALTEKKSRTTPEVKNILGKNGCSLAEPNAVSRLFELKGCIVVSGESVSEESLMEMAVDAGAEDLRSEEDVHVILTDPAGYSAVAEKLAEEGVETLESSVGFQPLDGTEVPPKDSEHVRRILDLVEKLEEHDDVQNVSHNLAVPGDGP